MTTSPEPIWCKACGTINEEATELLKEKEQNLRDLEVDLRKARARASAAATERNAQRALDPLRPDAEEVYGYWRQEIMPAAREFTGERFDAVIGRLKAGHTVETLKKAVDGAKARPWKGGRTDLTTICRNEKNLLMFVDFAEQVPARRSDPTLENLYARMVPALTDQIAERLGEVRGWSVEAIRDLGVGYDPGSRRIVFPARDAAGSLVGLSRFLPNAARRGGQTKNLAEGSRELFPPPEESPVPRIWLVEGEPDVVAMASLGFRAVGLPGVATWKDGWTERFARFDEVRIVLDCDEPGRRTAHTRSAQLSGVTHVKVLDLDAERDDGYDVNDLLLEKGPEEAARELVRLARGPQSAVLRLDDHRPADDDRSPVERVYEALDRLDCRPRVTGTGQIQAQCPNHDDRVPSLSVTAGDDQRCLLHCHAGCEPIEVLHALGLEWKDVFAA